MLKVIFLDIDGVLATNKQFSMNREKFMKKNEWASELKVPYPFDNGCVEILNQILDATDAEIVLSSDWKLHWNLIDIATIFSSNGVAKTPRMFTKNKPISFGNLEKNRANEIDLCIKNFDFKNFVVIDDLDVGKYLGDDSDRFVKTKDQEGLKQLGVKEKIISILNNYN